MNFQQMVELGVIRSGNRVKLIYDKNDWPYEGTVIALGSNWIQLSWTDAHGTVRRTVYNGRLVVSLEVVE